MQIPELMEDVLDVAVEESGKICRERPCEQYRKEDVCEQYEYQVRTRQQRPPRRSYCVTNFGRPAQFETVAPLFF